MEGTFAALTLAFVRGEKGAQDVLADYLAEDLSEYTKAKRVREFSLPLYGIAADLYLARNTPREPYHQPLRYIVCHAMVHTWPRGTVVSAVQLRAGQLDRLLSIGAVSGVYRHEEEPFGREVDGDWVPHAIERVDPNLGKPYRLALWLHCRSMEHCRHILLQSSYGGPVIPFVDHLSRECRKRLAREVCPSLTEEINKT